MGNLIFAAGTPQVRFHRLPREETILEFIGPLDPARRQFSLDAAEFDSENPNVGTFFDESRLSPTITATPPRAPAILHCPPRYQWKLATDEPNARMLHPLVWQPHPGGLLSDDYSAAAGRAALWSVPAVSWEPMHSWSKMTAANLYSRDYWTKRQTEHHELPDISKRLHGSIFPSAAAHWLAHLLPRKLPSARILEVELQPTVGPSVGLLGWAGYKGRWNGNGVPGW